MSRTERRAEKKTFDKITRRTYTYSECKKIAEAAVLEAEKDYDVRYATCLATALAAPPLNFGSVRVCRVVNLFFGQVEALKIGTVSEEEVREQALKVGVMIKNDDESISVYIDPTLKF